MKVAVFTAVSTRMPHCAHVHYLSLANIRPPTPTHAHRRPPCAAMDPASAAYATALAGRKAAAPQEQQLCYRHSSPRSPSSLLFTSVPQFSSHMLSDPSSSVVLSRLPLSSLNFHYLPCSSPRSLAHRAQMVPRWFLPCHSLW